MTEKEVDDWLLGLGYNRKQMLNLGIVFKKYQDPINFMLHSKYFILLADNVFGNNALLESMQLGLVPILSASNSTGLVIEKDRSGFVTSHDPRGLFETLELAFNLDMEIYDRMSMESIRRIKSNFSIESWDMTCHKMFEEL
jgi:glycosyltransferase involved in cell wall biosynthesis